MTTKPDFVTFFVRGVEHFNACEFWEAHESWEAIWLVAASEVEQFLQGLIQLAAAYHHVKRGTYRGAIRLFEAALGRLEPYAANYCDLDRKNAAIAARQLRRCLIDGAPGEIAYPKLVLLTATPAPPFVQW